MLASTVNGLTASCSLQGFRLFASTMLRSVHHFRRSFPTFFVQSSRDTGKQS